MLIVDPDKRFSIDQCLAHPWLTQNYPAVNDSTGGLVGGLAGLEVNRRAPVRERTLLSSLNSVQVTAEINTNRDKPPVKIFSKNKTRIPTPTKKEADPAQHRAAPEFMEMGGKGDQILFGDDSGSIYPAGDAVSSNKGKTNGR